MNKPDEDFDDEDEYEDDDGMNKPDEDFDDDDEYEDGQGHDGMADGDRSETGLRGPGEGEVERGRTSRGHIFNTRPPYSKYFTPLQGPHRAHIGPT